MVKQDDIGGHGFSKLAAKIQDVGIGNGAQGSYAVWAVSRRHYMADVGFPFQSEIGGLRKPGGDKNITLHQVDGDGPIILGVGCCRDEYQEFWANPQVLSDDSLQRTFVNPSFPQVTQLQRYPGACVSLVHLQPHYLFLI